MIDIHNHIIPAIDDGPDTLEQALELLWQAEADGIQRLVCTPHMHPGRYDNDITTIKPAFDDLVKQASDAEIGVQLAMAAEVRFSDEMMFQLRNKRIPMIGQWEGYDCLLLEMPHQNIPMGIEHMLEWLEKQKIRAVIAHPERNKELMAYPDRVLPLVERGALLQVTAGCIPGFFGEKAQTTARWLLDHELVQFVASDAHHAKRRPPAMKAAADVLDGWYGKDVRDRLTLTNPDLLTFSLFAG
ncbi:CpsB/CapC family capsule biosynthesis tyrosine phosphatase [uncultured Endozoicomonas sp.]|uniref:tyrosine-protein phosphatase n=1 Tax=uncultured Endozoicomonas sp. TaxID=432652 RepID=UPI00262F088A|nr:CpsB/CapC family capsule biosynthesis tyrosine phosphatase [uncultured Endozoicomonas sp.]